jgi:transposase-like protein
MYPSHTINENQAYRWIQQARDYPRSPDTDGPGRREGGRFLPLRDDIASTAFRYQTLPAAAIPPLPGKDHPEII